MARKRKKSSPRRGIGWRWGRLLQQRRFRLLVGAALLLLLGLGVMQFTAPVRLHQPIAYRVPLRGGAGRVDTLFPPYVVWRWLLPITGVRPGYYEIKPGETAFALWNRLRKGLQTPIRFYLKPQRSPKYLSAFLGQHLAHDSATWIQAFQTMSWAELGLDAYTWPVLFLPDVYELYWTISPKRLIERMKARYERFWTPERRKKAEAIGLTPIEVSILASIVEWESYRVSERPLIAGVYLNRLRLGMPLQADPTIIYAWGDFSVNRVTHRMLEIDSPYNTYKRRGLPPGPIGIPSLESIEAVLDYTPSSYLYFCARPDGSGYHDFSETYDQHLRKARLYQKALSQWLSQKK